MAFILIFDDFYILIAVISLILVITTEFLNPRYAFTTLIIEKNYIKKTTIIFIILFILLTVIRILGIILTY